MTNTFLDQIPGDKLTSLIHRMDIIRPIVRRIIEEEIVAIVPVSEEQYQILLKTWQAENSVDDEDIPAWLEERHLSLEDHRLNILRPYALKLFSEKQFGPGLEDAYLSNASDLAEVIYSMIRSVDSALIRELWIRIEEGETTFLDSASRYGEGPESSRKGLIGPVQLGTLYPAELRDSIRSLKINQVSSPIKLGDWHLLLRLESLTPAVFDANTRERLLGEALDKFLDARVDRYLEGKHTDSLQYQHD